MFAPRIAKPKSALVCETAPNRTPIPSTTLGSRLSAHEQGPSQRPDYPAVLTRNAATPSWSLSNLRIHAPTADDSNAPRKTAAANSETNRNEVAVPVQSMIQRKRGSGQPLGNEVRHRLERIFHFDFSTVRVHTDSEAGSLSRALGAKALTTGRDIFFDHGAYQPDNFRGQKLLAHELTHVSQQRGVAPSKLVLGQPEDQYEREADANSTNFAAASEQLKSADSLGAFRGGARPAVTPIRVTPVTSSSTSLVQRDKDKNKKKEEPAGPKPAITWAGEFTAPMFTVGSVGDVYGADIVISFMPNKSVVDAESIALVQTAQDFNSSIGNQVDPLDEVPQPNAVKTEKAQEVFKNRLVGDIQDQNFGRQIDQFPKSRTPLANTTVDANSTDLAKSLPDPDFKSGGQKIHTRSAFGQTRRARRRPRQPIRRDRLC